MDTTSNIPAWEASKENVLPIKRGRSVKGLSNVIEASKSASTALANQQTEDAFESSISQAKINSAPNSNKKLLEEYVLYFKWVQNAYPSNLEKALKILERCTVDLKDDDTLKNDIRFVKLWIEYAGMARSSNDVFSYMNSNKIGDKVALYWIAWAFVAEKAENFKLTDQIFQKGIRHLAEPKDILNKRYQQFQRRLARNYINMSESGQTLNTTSQEPSSTRTALRPISDENNQQSINSASARRPLQENNSSQRSAQTSRHNGHSTNSSFQIFSDVSTGNVLPTETLPANPHWKVLGTEAERKRENDGPVTKWSEGPLANKTNHVQKPPSAPIPIFVDESFKEQTSPQSKHKPETSHRGLSIRQQLEGDIERISKDPLARHKESEEASTSKNSKLSSKSEQIKNRHAPQSSAPTFNDNIYSSKTEKSQASGQSERSELSVALFSENNPATDNSKELKLKSKSSFAIFSDESKDAKQPARKPSLAIFSEDKNESKSKKPSFSVFTEESSDQQKTAKASFSIFSDDTNKQVKQNNPVEANSKQSSFQIFQDNTNAKFNQSQILATKQPFSIFSDRDSPQESQIQASEPVKIFTDTRSTDKSPSHSNKTSDEIDDVMREMGILGDEDDTEGDGTTINTRLAMKDIDSMFCSPTASAKKPRKGDKSFREDNSFASLSVRRPFLHSNFETITGLPNDLSAIHETSREDSSYFGTLITPSFDGKNKKDRGLKSRALES